MAAILLIGAFFLLLLAFDRPRLPRREAGLVAKLMRLDL